MNEYDYNDLFNTVYECLTNNISATAENVLEGIHPADIADLYEDLDHKYRMKFLDLIPNVMTIEVLKHLESAFKSEVVKYLGIEHFRKSFNDLTDDDLVQLAESLDPREQLYLINMVSNSHKSTIDILMKYSENSVGRSMSLDFVVVPHFWTVEKALSYFASQSKLEKNCSEVFVVNDLLNPIGVIPLNLLMASDKQKPVSQIANYDIITLNEHADQEKAYSLFMKYRLKYIPVVGKSGRMVGVLRSEDILKIVEEEVTEDYLKFTGSSDTDPHDSFWYTCFTRLRWLSVSVLNALLSPVIINLFQSSIEKVISLAALMPVVSSIGGNIGMQAVSVIIRGVSSEQLREKKFVKMIWKEAAIGAVNGLITGIFIGILSALWFKNAILGATLAAAMFFCAGWAAFIGASLPILFDKLGYDAALSSGPLITTITDVSGFAIFLGLATILMT